ncbi:hypothetical protein EEZ25_12550 [Micromonospora aurantiaca]|uniref:AAA family ATPase n=1 Tax=Micromonospora aurantiaca (nom. illeg.) TaxID=47850 RepID=UPI000F3DC61E|nr:AAA family ATPase [Micromonospora aurantiaca]RNI02226.1 hypothetical protein EEZ25_12550 [Micromonospora aurantiaca]
MAAPVHTPHQAPAQPRSTSPAGVLEAPRKRLQKVVNEFFGESKEVDFTYEKIQARLGEETLEPESFSSGEKQLLRILVETLVCGDNTIIIDEPEISMHIDWQRELLSTMREINPTCQIIVATHSPDIMATVSDDKIIRL